MNYKEIIDQAYLKYIEANYAYALFDVNIRLKWENLCIEQQGFLPEVKKCIPQAWKRKITESDLTILSFDDCSREIAA